MLPIVSVEFEYHAELYALKYLNLWSSSDGVGKVTPCARACSGYVDVDNEQLRASHLDRNGQFFQVRFFQIIWWLKPLREVYWLVNQGE